MSAAHEYLSTACWHALFDGNAALHTVCRNSCKYCDHPCDCSCHGERDEKHGTAWVDQARDIARDLLVEIEASAPTRMSTVLRERIETDPALFWLRGEEMPPGVWRGTSSDK